MLEYLWRMLSRASQLCKDFFIPHRVHSLSLWRTSTLHLNNKGEMKEKTWNSTFSKQAPSAWPANITDIYCLIYAKFLIFAKYNYIFVVIIFRIECCDSNPCQNSGTCQVVNNSYVCSCLPCFSGDQCQIGKGNILKSQNLWNWI